MSGSAQRIEGVVLCRVGAHRLAVLAGEVGVVELPTAQAVYAGRLFDAGASTPADARVLRHETAAITVDTLEVHGERVSLFPVPELIGRLVGGALKGFVEVQGALWPVISLPALAAYLAGAAEGATA